MPTPTRTQLALYAALAIAIAVLGGRALMRDRAAGATTGGVTAAAPRSPASAPATPPPGAGSTSASNAAAEVSVSDAAGGPLYVHVAGAVRRPGVYRLRDGDRVADAVERAGGPSRHASIDAVNLAAKLADGQQVVVPRQATADGALAVSTPPGAGAADGSATGGATGAPSASAGGAAVAAAPVDLNAATLEQLDTLDGVGPATAQKILDWRTAHGGFRSVDDLAQVPGIGAKRMAALRPKVRV